ncbi:MAG: LPS export ABC transporter periplasmic protein LptC [Bacteroidales bacterium]
MKQLLSDTDNKNKHLWALTKSIAIIFYMLMLFACSNDMEMVSAISKEKELPVDIAKDVVISYSDSGQVKVHLDSKKMESYAGEKPYIEMPEGLYVKFYDNNGSVKSTLTANYAISHEKSKTMEAKNDVVLINVKGEQLNTEHLIWKQQENKIVSNEFVKITTDDKILFGEGLEADETMDNWTIKNPKGTIYLDDEYKGNNRSQNDSLSPSNNL